MKTIYAALLGLTLALAGCGDGLSGRYADDTNLVTIKFLSDSTLAYTTLGQTHEVAYQYDGQHLQFNDMPDHTMNFQRRDDGTFEGMFMVLRKR